jgi:hypothetical protein
MSIVGAAIAASMPTGTIVVRGREVCRARLNVMPAAQLTAPEANQKGRGKERQIRPTIKRTTNFRMIIRKMSRIPVCVRTVQVGWFLIFRSKHLILMFES